MNSLYRNRLIKLDLPIKQISVHARPERSVRHWHIPALHIQRGCGTFTARRAAMWAGWQPAARFEHCITAAAEIAQAAISLSEGRT